MHRDPQLASTTNADGNLYTTCQSAGGFASPFRPDHATEVSGIRQSIQRLVLMSCWTMPLHPRLVEPISERECHRLSAAMGEIS
jgi:hypothetical protein